MDGCGFFRPWRRSDLPIERSSRPTRHNANPLPWGRCGRRSIATRVGLHQALHERMAHYIGIGEAAESHPLHPIQYLGSLHEPTDLAGR